MNCMASFCGYITSSCGKMTPVSPKFRNFDFKMLIFGDLNFRVAKLSVDKISRPSLEDKKGLLKVFGRLVIGYGLKKYGGK